MQIAPDQGQLMALLIQLMGAKKILEIGTFAGYSALWMALALPADGTLITCDIEERCREFAPHYWQTAGVADKVDLRIAPAIDTLNVSCWELVMRELLTLLLLMLIKLTTATTTNSA